MSKKLFSTLALGVLCCLPLTRSSAQTCIRCPDNANDTAIGTAFGVFVNRNGLEINVSGQTVGSCEPLILKANVSYNAFGISGGIGSGFTGGTGRIIFPGGTSVDVTPADMATTLVGPAPCGTTPVKQMNNANYTLTAADIVAGVATFTFQFTNGTSLLPNAQNQCVLKVSASPQQSVSVAPIPTCTVSPANQVCPGGTATFTVTPAGAGPFTFRWTGPASFSSTNQTITINNAQTANAGFYVATVRDQFGCSSTCSNSLTVFTNPIVTIAPTNVCVGSPVCLIANVTTFGSTVSSYSWTKVGSSTVLSTADRLCFNNPQLADAGTYQVIVTDSHSCSGTNTGTLTVRPNPTCNVTGPTDVCEFTTNTYTSTVGLSNGVVTHSWAFVGAHPNATFVGSTTGPTVQVAAGAAVTSRDCFSLTDAITLDGCPGACTNTFCIVPCRPAIRVYKQVVCYSNICEPFSADLTAQKIATGIRVDPANPANCPAFCYRITVTNTGNLPLSNLTVTDDSVPDPDLNLSGCGFPTTLPVGASASCIVASVSHCSNTTNVVTATGTGQTGTGPITVNAKDTNAVVVVPISVTCQFQILTNGVVVSGTCPNLALSTPYTVRLLVRNNGQYALQNVTVANVAGLCIGATNMGSLAVNETKSFDCAYQCTVQSSNYFAASVTAEVSQSQGHICAVNTAGQTIRATTSCSACVACTGQPRICVTKEVVCELPNGCTNNWSHFATGAKTADNSQCPSFCYRVRVTNCGEEALNNVTVVDNVINLAGCNFPATLAVGQTVECILAGVEHCQNVTNTVTASGTGASSGIGVRTNDTAAVVVLPISITCNITVNGKPHESIPCDGQGHLITNAVEVCNTGSLPLSDIAINAPDLVTLGCTNVASLRLSLLPGQCTNVLLCIDMVTCPPDCGLAFSNHIRITATVDQTLTNVCSWTVNPSNQVVAVTASTECTATVECIPPPKTGCTPGFWKNCTIHWQPTGYRTDQSVSSVFSLGGCCTSLGNSSLLGALGFGGGSGVCGGAQILLRAAVAALLNGSSPEVDYPFTGPEVIALVNAALQSCDRSIIIALASELDRDNNLGCTSPNGQGLPCHRLSDLPRVVPNKVLDAPRVAPTRN